MGYIYTNELVNTVYLNNYKYFSGLLIIVTFTILLECKYTHLTKLLFKNYNSVFSNLSTTLLSIIQLTTIVVNIHNYKTIYVLLIILLSIIKLFIISLDLYYHTGVVVKLNQTLSILKFITLNLITTKFFKNIPYKVKNTTFNKNKLKIIYFFTNTNIIKTTKLSIRENVVLTYNSKKVMFKSNALYSYFKTTILTLLITIFFFFFFIIYFQIQLLKQLAIWFVVGMLFFWLISGFNFFIKRYQFGKFTSQIQRFWKRTNIYFWIIEGFLIALYFYYFLNSSQEPMYMYDYASLNQEYLVSLYSIFLNIVILSTIIYILYYTLFRLNSIGFSQILIFLIAVSAFLLLSFFIETYQFLYILSSFKEDVIIFSDEENLWNLTVDQPIIRSKQQYLLVCLIAKYWHFLFIFISWIFFLAKSFEKKQVTMSLLGYNTQNLVILYCLNFLCYLQWFKWVYRRFFDLPYNWFFINTETKLIYKLIHEIVYTVKSWLNIFKFNPLLNININYKSHTIWNVNSLLIWKYI